MSGVATAERLSGAGHKRDGILGFRSAVFAEIAGVIDAGADSAFEFFAPSVDIWVGEIHKLFASFCISFLASDNESASFVVFDDGKSVADGETLKISENVFRVVSVVEFVAVFGDLGARFVGFAGVVENFDDVSSIGDVGSE